MLSIHRGLVLWNKLFHVLSALGVCLVPPACSVAPRCYGDEDCAKKKICSAEGRCVFECAVDEDCEVKFGLEYNCSEGRCEIAPACVTCSFAHAENRCVHGNCQLVACQEGYFDRDDGLSNGCEYHCEEGALDANGNPDDGCECTPANEGSELCNDLDDDCDGEVDEAFALLTDVANCGACNRACSVGPQAVPLCESGYCVYLCQSGYYDNDGSGEDGCEDTVCVPVTEVCNGRDDDCNCRSDTNDDGVFCGPGDEGVDESFDKTTVEQCGPYCVACDFAHAEAICAGSGCQIVGCDVGYFNLDNKINNGCEYACIVTGKEVCNSIDDDCDGLVDEGDVCTPSCPSDMVAVGTAYCIDRFEASRSDATAASQGAGTARAYSRSGVLPWMVNPMTAGHLLEFQAACSDAGKYLCTKDEWIAACVGPDSTTFVYGNTFDREACNCVDSYCDDYCSAQGLASCSTAENCGYSYYCFHEATTGSFPLCTNDYGTLDINGNVWEVVPSKSDARGYEVRGGGFNCSSPSARVSCDFNANWTELNAGFRCCKAVE